MNRTNLFAILIIISTIFLAGLGLYSEVWARKLFTHYSIYFLYGMTGWWLWTLYEYLLDKKDLLQKHQKRIFMSFGIGLVAASVVFSSNDISFKVNSDETNLLSVSRSLAIDKTPKNHIMGKNFHGTFRSIKFKLPKRPLIFPFFMSISHSLFGFSPSAPFVLNFIFLSLIITLISFACIGSGGVSFGIPVILLVLSNSLLGIYATSAGFGMASLFFLFLSLYLFYKQTGKEVDNNLLLTTVLLFSNIRYESIAVGAVILVSVFLLKMVVNRVRFMGYLSWFMFFMLPYVWQRIITVKGNIEDQTKTLFSIDNLIENSWILLKNLFTLNQSLPYPSLLLVFSILLLPFLLVKYKKVGRYFNRALVISFCIGLNLFIFLFHYYGVWNSAVSARFFMPFTLSLLLVGPILFTFTSYFSDSKLKFAFLLFSMGAFSYYNSAVYQSRFVNSLTLNREVNQHLYPFFETLGTKNILIVHPRPGQFSAMEYGAINSSYAKRNWKRLKNELKNGLYQHLFIVNQKKYDDHSVEWFRDDTPLKRVYYFQKKRGVFVEVLEVE